MQAIHMAAGAIQLGAGEAFVCAGVESMSRVPMMGFNPMPNPGAREELPAAYVSMGVTAENVARKVPGARASRRPSRSRAIGKAAAAQAEGRLADEIVPIGEATPRRRGWLHPPGHTPRRSPR
jgi:acetyl-CoA acyltransferase